MKVAVIIDSSVTAGGGFDQALTAVLQINRLCKGRFELEVMTSRVSNISVLAEMGIDAIQFKYAWLDRFLAKFAISSLWQSMQLWLKLIGPFEKNLIARGVDIVYFVTPTGAPLGLQQLNFITTVWDLCHRDTPEFPEAREFNAIFIQERGYRSLFSSAYLILTDSDRLADLASFRYGVDRERFLSMPFSPSPLISQANSLSDEIVLKKYDLTPGYFYYPAQFWAHKNHIRIIEALTVLRDENKITPTVVFSGKDFGTMTLVRQAVIDRRLESQVKILGFVPSGEVRGLYQGALAVLMPTYFGPTNLPPLEAWSMGKPLLYSSHLKEHVKDAALLASPDIEQDWATAMVQVMQVGVAEKLVARGQQRLQEIVEERDAAEQLFLNHLVKFSKRMHCWCYESHSC